MTQVSALLSRVGVLRYFILCNMTTVLRQQQRTYSVSVSLGTRDARG